MCRAAIDSQVLATLTRARRALPAQEIADRAGVSLMATVYSLRRLQHQGHAEVSTITVPADYGRRPYTTVRVYRKPVRTLPSLWPAWLCPSALPVGRVSVRVVGVF